MGTCSDTFLVGRREHGESCEPHGGQSSAIYRRAGASLEGEAEFFNAYESVSGMTRANRRSGTTLPHWMAKLFAVLEDIQDDVVLSGKW